MSSIFIISIHLQQIFSPPPPLPFSVHTLFCSNNCFPVTNLLWKNMKCIGAWRGGREGREEGRRGMNIWSGRRWKGRRETVHADHHLRILIVIVVTNKVAISRLVLFCLPESCRDRLSLRQSEWGRENEKKRMRGLLSEETIRFSNKRIFSLTSPPLSSFGAPSPFMSFSPCLPLAPPLFIPIPFFAQKCRMFKSYRRPRDLWVKDS